MVVRRLAAVLVDIWWERWPIGDVDGWVVVGGLYFFSLQNQ